MSDVLIAPYDQAYADSVRELFIRVNRLLAPSRMKDAFEDYIAASLAEEIDRIPAYYGERNGWFWIATIDQQVVGMFGLEPSGPGAMELRRMYVDPDYRRRGIAQNMLQRAEAFCRDSHQSRLDLSTSEIQSDAVAFYKSAGYQLVREEVASEASNKTIGGGIRRYHFAKTL